jgi:hypothetical protein
MDFGKLERTILKPEVEKVYREAFQGEFMP